MGITQRKEREKEDLRKRILDAAREVFLEKGYETTSIRNIAEKIEYSPTTIYLYYKDKDAIFHALHSEGFQIMNNKMAVLQSVADPFERLKAMGRIYIEFCLENKELYDLMFIEPAPINFIESDDNKWHEGKSAFEALKATLKDCVNEGYFKFADVELAAFVVWSTMHGMCSLSNRNRCAKVISEKNLKNILQKGYKTYTDMLEKMVLKKK